MKLKRFQQFITESKYGWSEESFAYSQWRKETFNDFDFEKDILELVQKVEQTWAHLEDVYDWNRERRQWRKDHFALDVKVHAWPDSDKVREILGEPDMSEEAINDEWWVWFNDEREGFVNDLIEIYPWIQDIGWGGKSGGWLLLQPPHEAEDIRNDIESDCQVYRLTKEELKESDDWQDILNDINDETLNNMHDYGLSNESDEILNLKEQVDNIRTYLTKELADLTQWESDMNAIQARVSKFEDKAEEYFYDWLRGRED